MKKVTAENIESLYQPDREIYSHWAILNEKITHFCNYSTLKQFTYIFGDDEGERLWKHFKSDCDSIYQKLRTYLTQEQTNTLIVSIYVNDMELFTL